MFTIRPDDLTGAQTRALVTAHVAAMRSSSPPGTAYALELTGLQEREITVYTAWHGDSLAGMGALKRLDARCGEVKSMRTHPDYLRMGVARALLEHIIEHARSAGLRRLSLETGSGPAFTPTLTLYEKRGFRPGGAFGGYAPSAFNQFLHLDL